MVLNSNLVVKNYIYKSQRSTVSFPQISCKTRLEIQLVPFLTNLKTENMRSCLVILLFFSVVSVSELLSLWPYMLPYFLFNRKACIYSIVLVPRFCKCDQVSCDLLPSRIYHCTTKIFLIVHDHQLVCISEAARHGPENYGNETQELLKWASRVSDWGSRILLFLFSQIPIVGFIFKCFLGHLVGLSFNMVKNFLLLENFHSNMSPDLGFFFFFFWAYSPFCSWFKYLQ